MRLVSIASGSSGNCIYVGSEHSHILVDAGISNKRIEQGLNEIGLKGSELDGVVITHEHSDHIKSLGVLAYVLLAAYNDKRMADSLSMAFSPENIMCRFTEQRRLWRK